MEAPNHYDTFTGRWTAPDPLGGKGGDPDWYGYCLDDPVNGFDPLGLFVLGGAGLATAAMGATGLIQYAPQINQWGIAIANDVMDGRYGFLNLAEDVGSYALDAVKAYPDVVFENTRRERERLANRAAHYQGRREEDQRRASKAKTKREAAEAVKIDARRADSQAAKKNTWGDDGRDSLDGTSGNKGQSVASSGGGWW